MVGSVLFIALLIGIGIVLCLRRRSKKKGKSPAVDLGADDRLQGFHHPASRFSPFEYQLAPSPREEVSEYSRGSITSSPGARNISSPSSQALLFAWDHTAASNNPQSTYSMYSRDTTNSATQWGEMLSARNNATMPTPYTFLAPSRPPIREKRRLVMTNGAEEEASSPAAVNRMRFSVPSPPPYTAR